MQIPKFQRFAAVATFAFLIAGHNASRATPLADDAAAREWAESRPTRSLSDTEIVGAGIARPEIGILGPTTAEGAVQQFLHGPSSEAGGPWTRDSATGFQYGTNTGSPFEVFRSLVNVPKGGPQSAARRPGATTENDFLGADARELIDDAVRGIVDSAIELRVNEQGRTTFSVLGMGDFGVMMSGDRNEVALVSGDDVLLTAHRMPHAQFGPGTGPSPFDARTSGHSTAGPGGTGRDHSLQQALDTLQEIAVHPLSLLIYAIVGGFAVLWNIMSSQTERRAASPPAFRTDSAGSASHRASGRRRSRRSHRA